MSSAAFVDGISVFDGKSTSSGITLTFDEAHPLSVYGVSKLGGERHVLGAKGPGPASCYAPRGYKTPRAGICAHHAASDA